jgi:hypothetical protein
MNVREKDMSDFGSMATVHRSDGASTSTSDESLIKSAAQKLVLGERDRISDFAEFNLRFGGSSQMDGSRGIMIGLTEYWASDHVNDEAFDSEAVIERDRPLAERFGQQLQDEVGPIFKVEVYCGEW